MKYENYLMNKNLSQNTIRVYLIMLNSWNEYLNQRTPNKTLFVKFIKQYTKNHQANSVHLLYCAILSYFHFEKRYKLINECRDIHLPKTFITNKPIINLNDFNQIKDTIKLNTWYEKRNWLIFCCFFLTGIRASEINFIKKDQIYDSNKLKINGKGNRTRIIILPKYLLNLLLIWNHNSVTINTDQSPLSSKQVIYIIKKISLKYFNKELTPHSLRRSYATNLLKHNANIEIVRKSLGHTNINTTSRYLQFNEDDMVNEINKVFNS